MVATEFLVELQTIQDMFEWTLIPGRYSGPERRARPRLHIRGVCKYGPEHFLFEPIGAVCYIRTGKACTEDAWLDAANSIELSLIDASDLIAAANDRAWAEVGERREPHGYVQRLRQRLATSVGLNLP